MVEESAIIPTINAKTHKEFSEKYEKVKSLSRRVQIDVLDGVYAVEKTVSLSSLKEFRGKSDFHVNLLCEDPVSYLKDCRKFGANRVILQYESLESYGKVTDAISVFKKAKFEVGLAISPMTPFDSIIPFVSLVDVVVFMSVKPGKEGQNFEDITYEKVRRMHDFDPRVTIQIDGGIKVEEIRRLVRNGASLFSIGSFLSTAEFPHENYDLLVSSVELGKKEKEHVFHISQTYSKITPLIYLGPNRCNERVCFDRELIAAGIDAEICLEEFKVTTTVGVNYYYWFPTKDHQAPTIKQLNVAVRAMDDMVEQKIKMYVHCELGHTRSPSLVVAYFIYKGMSFDEAFEFVRGKRPSIGITSDQKKTLVKFEKLCRVAGKGKK